MRRILRENGLSIVWFGLFFSAFIIGQITFGRLEYNAAGGAREYNQDQMEHGSAELVSTLQYLGTSRFWFESFQNWQSEFLAVGSMVVLSIWLRQRGSPESKPVDAPHSQTGKD